jgi:hypothetical protein
MSRFSAILACGMLCFVATVVVFGQQRTPSDAPHVAGAASPSSVSWAIWRGDAERFAFWQLHGAVVTADEGWQAKEQGLVAPGGLYADFAAAQAAVVPAAGHHVTCSLADGTIATFWSLERMEVQWARHQRQQRHQRSQGPQAATGHSSNPAVPATHALPVMPQPTPRKQ